MKKNSEVMDSIANGKLFTDDSIVAELDDSDTFKKLLEEFLKRGYLATEL